MQRLGWKTDLLARIEAAEAGPAIPLTGGSPPPAYAKVAVAGRFDHGREALLGAEVRGTVLGAHLLTPLLRERLPPVLVDRGWVPLDRASPIDRPEGEVIVTGWVRAANERGALAAKDDPAGRRFYTFDPPAIAAALDLTGALPFGIVALGERGAAWPMPAQRLPRPNNPHLGYAITWYGLAGALIAVLAVFLRRRLKEPA